MRKQKKKKMPKRQRIETENENGDGNVGCDLAFMTVGQVEKVDGEGGADENCECVMASSAPTSHVLSIFAGKIRKDRPDQAGLEQILRQFHLAFDTAVKQEKAAATLEKLYTKSRLQMEIIEMDVEDEE